jgi:hypothetical protein
MARRFAAALDDHDWAAATNCLAPDCIYLFRGTEARGRDQIIDSYRRIGEWVAATFESVSYESKVEALGPARAAITFRDVLDHQGHHLDFRCQQILTTDDEGRVVQIEHIDFPGEPEKVVAFNAACGVKKPG